MTYLFIADLHLSPNHPRLVRGFLDLLDAYQNKNTQLYILGDWFNAWIGDDYTAAWLDEVVARLKQFSQAGNQIQRNQRQNRKHRTVPGSHQSLPEPD